VERNKATGRKHETGVDGPEGGGETGKKGLEKKAFPPRKNGAGGGFVVWEDERERERSTLKGGGEGGPVEKKEHTWRSPRTTSHQEEGNTAGGTESLREKEADEE